MAHQNIYKAFLTLLLFQATLSAAAETDIPEWLFLEAEEGEEIPEALQALMPREQRFFIACRSGYVKTVETILNFILYSNASMQKINNPHDLKLFVNMQDADGKTPLHYAVLGKNEATQEVLNNYAQIFKLLALAGADMYIEDDNGITPLDLLSKKNAVQVAIVGEKVTDEAQSYTSYYCRIS